MAESRAYAGKISPTGNRVGSATILATDCRIQGCGGAGKTEILLPFDVSLSLWQVAHGACAQLYHWRRAVALSPHAGLQRVAAYGLGRIRPAGRECGNAKQCAACKVDLRQHCLHAQTIAEPGAGNRLGPRACHLPAGLLPMESVVVSAHAGKGPRLQNDGYRELGPCRPDSACQ